MEDPFKRPRGRPRKYPAHLARDGAPHLTVRLAPDWLEQVKQLGGSTWVRGLIEKALADFDLEARLARALNAPTPPAPAAPLPPARSTPPPPQKTRPPKTPPSPSSGPKKPLPPPQFMEVHVWLRVENNHKFGRGRCKALAEIERLVLERYRMEKEYASPKGCDCEYFLTIPYTSDLQLDQTVEAIVSEAREIADSRNCLAVVEVSSLNLERVW